MRLDAPRIPPVSDADATPEQRQRLDALRGPNREPLNIFRTLVRMPAAYDGFMAWGSVLLSRRNPLPRRERELVILRTGYLCKAGYEWAQHDVIARGVGVTADEVARVKAGADAPEWSSADAALLRATDELVRDHFVNDTTWAALGEHFDDDQRMAVVMTVGQYTQVSMMLNTFGVQLDPGLELDPDLRA